MLAEASLALPQFIEASGSDCGLVRALPPPSSGVTSWFSIGASRSSICGSFASGLSGAGLSRSRSCTAPSPHGDASSSWLVGRPRRGFVKAARPAASVEAGCAPAPAPSAPRSSDDPLLGAARWCSVAAAFPQASGATGWTGLPMSRFRPLLERCAGCASDPADPSPKSPRHLSEALGPRERPWLARPRSLPLSPWGRAQLELLAFSPARWNPGIEAALASAVGPGPTSAAEGAAEGDQGHGHHWIPLPSNALASACGSAAVEVVLASAVGPGPTSAASGAA